MSDPDKVEALVHAECATRTRRGSNGGSRGTQGSSAEARTKRPTRGYGSHASGKRPVRPEGVYALSRAVQRARGSRPRRLDRSHSQGYVQGPSELLAEVECLRAAAVHHWRARMMVQLSHLYTEGVWDAMKMPRKFFIKHRGFGPTHGRADLPSFRRLFLRCALGSAERATQVAPFSVECATLHACILSLLTTLGPPGDGGKRTQRGGAARPDAASASWERHLSRACASCRHAMRVYERRDGGARDFESRILHRPGGESEDEDEDEEAIVPSSPPSAAASEGPWTAEPPLTTAGAGADVAGRVASLRHMAAYAAHALAELRGGWDVETSWVRELEWGPVESRPDEPPRRGPAGGDGDESETKRPYDGKRGAGGIADRGGGDGGGGGGEGEGGLDAVAAHVDELALEPREEEKEDGAEGEESADWDMWQSPCILDYSVAFLRDHRAR